MRDANILSSQRCMPRMSWHPRNLYNLWLRSIGGRSKEIQFHQQLETSLFKQRWVSKALVRAYHGDFINEKIFKRYYLPQTLPDVRPAKRTAATGPKGNLLDDTKSLSLFARREGGLSKAARERDAERDSALAEEGDEVPPVASLMFSDVERRVDVFIFRACLAHSVYEARRMVIHGDVKLNGKKHTNPNTRIAPGDMVTVNPAAIRFLQPAPAAPIDEKHPRADDKASTDETTDEASASATETDTSPDETSPQSSAEAQPSSEPESESESGASDSTHPSSSAPSHPSKYAAKLAKRAEAAAAAESLTPFTLPPYASPFIFVPAYIEVSFLACSAIYVRHPTARPNYSEIPTPYDADGAVVRLAWEWYSKRRVRLRSAKRRAREPENRKEAEKREGWW
ncbi:alpha-L RNA-binding motif-containing protein [Punctularia strigosozonata HHB-11173 SS5]|uniref:alpha-L RNA-binding motif-containing protein n=1 Tax=Punctularia strigosozonata (strain HHB-11173) TaxID=741275 RepID=UPI000441625F|nr:alpha-L RNA-binding motif-containing protein [Punctularia strigosozonata HHB-11173 SS5]EIN05476.1 alpha-L RNA-binding motif-containing protein [Punctularia strigosozonata HHB-11173 SS5]